MSFAFGGQRRKEGSEQGHLLVWDLKIVGSSIYFQIDTGSCFPMAQKPSNLRLKNLACKARDVGQDLGAFDGYDAASLD